MALDTELWGKTLKPLPDAPKPKAAPHTPKGMVRSEDYERKQFQQAFKK